MLREELAEPAVAAPAGLPGETIVTLALDATLRMRVLQMRPCEDGPEAMTAAALTLLQAGLAFDLWRRRTRSP